MKRIIFKTDKQHIVSRKNGQIITAPIYYEHEAKVDKFAGKVHSPARENARRLRNEVNMQTNDTRLSDFFKMVAFHLLFFGFIAWGAYDTARIALTAFLYKVN